MNYENFTHKDYEALFIAKRVLREANCSVYEALDSYTRDINQQLANKMSASAIDTRVKHYMQLIESLMGSHWVIVQLDDETIWKVVAVSNVLPIVHLRNGQDDRRVFIWEIKKMIKEEK